MITTIHSINLPKIVQIGWGHHVDFCVWKNRPLLLAKGVYAYHSWLCSSQCETKTLAKWYALTRRESHCWKYASVNWVIICLGKEWWTGRRQFTTQTNTEKVSIGLSVTKMSGILIKVQNAFHKYHYTMSSVIYRSFCAELTILMKCPFPYAIDTKSPTGLDDTIALCEVWNIFSIELIVLSISFARMYAT